MELIWSLWVKGQRPGPGLSLEHCTGAQISVKSSFISGLTAADINKGERKRLLADVGLWAARYLEKDL